MQSIAVKNFDEDYTAYSIFIQSSSFNNNAAFTYSARIINISPELLSH
jgi:hypothetical protein